MQFLMFKVLTIVYAAMQLWYRATPFVMQMTAGGTDQIISSAVGGGVMLVRPIVKKSAALLARSNEHRSFSSLVIKNFRLA